MSSIDTVLAEVRAKRVRQIGHHGYSFRHDDEHDRGELAMAAIPYIQAAWCQLTPDELQVYWPWEGDSFKPAPTDTKRELLLNAAALLVAEIERLDRAEVNG